MEEIFNTVMARYIWSILTDAPEIPMSWGVVLDTVSCTEDSLAFHVQGFLHTGTVKIVYNEGSDLFDILIINEDGNIKEKIEGVYNDELCNMIDNKIECCPEYPGEYTDKVMDYLINS